MKTALPLLIGIGLALGQAVAQAEDVVQKPLKVSIEKQNLRDALNDWAQQTGYELVAEIRVDLTSPKVEGLLTPQAALEQLLRGTPLTYRWMNDRLVAINEKPLLLPAALLKSDSTQAPQAEKPLGATTTNGELQPSGASSAEKNQTSRRIGGPDKQELEVVIVTGTYIPGGVKPTSQVIVLDSGYIERTGYSTTSELFRSLPQNFAGGNAGATEDGRFGIGTNVRLNIATSTGINLRGLGNTSTLVLVNGRRLAPSTYGSIADISHIPLAAIDRIEILTDGSSALYGSDAVAGVVNILLKKDYEGAETRLRFGSVTSGSRDEKGASQLLGTSWNSGNAMLTLDYNTASELLASDRDFMSNYSSPTFVFPDTKTKAATFNVRQDITDRVSFESDGVFGRRDIEVSENQFDVQTGTDATTKNAGVTAALRFKLTQDWSADIAAEYGREDEGRKQVITDATGVRNDNLSDLFRQSAAHLLVTGHPMELKSGSVGIALGASFRKEDFDADQFQTQTDGSDPIVNSQHADRDITSAYAELHLPLVSPSQAIALVESFDVSAVVRYDDYSDFGSTTNPKFGIRWGLTPSLSLQASYGDSFRAPHPAQTVGESVAPFLFAFPLTGPDGVTPVPAFIVSGGSLSLQPERATTFSAGFEFKALEGLKFTGNYYDVKYHDRIIQPSPNFGVLTDPAESSVLVSGLADDAAAAAFRDDVVSRGGTFVDFIGTDVAGVRYVYDLRQRNAAQTHQAGFDFGVEYSQAIGSGALSSRVNVSNIRYIDEQLLSTSAAVDTADTFGNPTNWRGRVDVSWTAPGWTVGSAVNYVDGYVNSTVVGDPPVDSWVTVDLFGQLSLGEIFRSPVWSGMTVSISAQNVFDKDPPFAAAPLGANYDPANANPLGRFVAAELRKRW